MNLDTFPRIAGKLLKNVVSKGDPSGVYLTFDDGPDPDFTMEIIRILSNAECPATFFVTGSQVEKHPTIVEHIHKEGHTIGSHGYQHNSLLLKSTRLINDDIHKSCEVIRKIIGTPPILFRPPYGRFGFTLLKVIRNQKMKIILWSLSGKDWKQSDSDEIVQRIINKIVPGDIILLHDRGTATESTIRALPPIIDGIRKKELTLKRLGQNP